MSLLSSHHPSFIEVQVYNLEDNIHGIPQLQRVRIKLSRKVNSTSAVLPPWGLTLSIIPVSQYYTNNPSKEENNINYPKSYITIGSVRNISKYYVLNKSECAIRETSSCGLFHPGDMILSLNDLSAAQFHDDMVEVASYLSNLKELEIVILRHPRGQIAARFELNRSSSSESRSSDRHGLSHAASQASVHTIMQILLARRMEQVQQQQAFYNHQQQFRLFMQQQQQILRQQQYPSQSLSKMLNQWNHSDNNSMKNFSRPNQSSIIRRVTTSFYRDDFCYIDTKRYINPIFGIAFEDNDDTLTEEGNRNHLFLSKIDNIHSWLQKRKHTWRLHRYNKHLAQLVQSDDQDEEMEGDRNHLFLTPIKDFAEWLEERRLAWRQNWSPYDFDDDDMNGDDSNRNQDFWSQNGFSNFNDWLATRKLEWMQNYSWQKQKRKRIAEDVGEQVYRVFYPSSLNYSSEKQKLKEFTEWISIKKNQWLFNRRKKQRLLVNNGESSPPLELQIENKYDKGEVEPSPTTVCTLLQNSATQQNTKNSESIKTTSNQNGVILKGNSHTFHVDRILEEEEKKKMALKKRNATDLMFIFDTSLGAPDDVVAHLISYLHPSEHSKLLFISLKTSRMMKSRSNTWQQLCPPRWNLPRRPRKPWYEVYLTKFNEEETRIRKISDEILSKACVIMNEGDSPSRIKKLVSSAEKRFDRFDINYCSPVLLERSSMLNLATMKGRFKIIRWLVEKKSADIETCDRGGFTPLMNAAYAGNRQLVRYFMSHGCNRYAIGTEHSSTALAPAGFRGLDAEGWARKRGHEELGNLIKFGLP